MIPSSVALRFRISSRFFPFFCTLNTLTISPNLQYHQSLRNPKSKPLYSSPIPIRPISVIPRIEPDSRAPIVTRFSTMSTAGDDTRGTVSFKLSPSSFLKIQKGDITRWAVDGSSDAIVCLFLS